MPRTLARICVLAGALCVAPLAHAQGVGTAFTYQGRLTDNGQPASGAYDLSFSLYSSASALFSSAGPVALDNVQVVGGLFTVKLDFGSEFAGAERWLSISVRPGAATGSYVTLSPRQELTPAPYAISASGLNLPVVENGHSDSSLIIPGLLSISQSGTSNAIHAATSSTGAAVRAVAGSTGPALYASAPIGGTCLQIQTGGITVYGSDGPVHTVGTMPMDPPTDTLTVDNPLCNGKPGALLIVTPQRGRNIFAQTWVNPVPVFVAYDDAAAKWTVRSFGGVAIPPWSMYTVLIVNREY